MYFQIYSSLPWTKRIKDTFFKQLGFRSFGGTWVCLASLKVIQNWATDLQTEPLFILLNFPFRTIIVFFKVNTFDIAFSCLGCKQLCYLLCFIILICWFHKTCEAYQLSYHLVFMVHRVSMIEPVDLALVYSTLIVLIIS